MVGMVGCGGSEGPPDSQFEMGPADISLANDVRAMLQNIEPTANPADIGQQMVENLQGMIEQPAAAKNKETYQKMLDAAKALASGDQAKLGELKQLADTLPK
jgi:hypothetical protein